MISIIASDLDGTLLTPDHKIAHYTQDVLQRLHAIGKHFVFATGRHHIDVADMRNQIGIPAYMITSNGACVHNAKGELIFQQDLDPQIIRQAIDLVKHDPELKIHIFRHNDWLLSAEDPNLKNLHLSFSYQLFDVEKPPTENVSKLFITRDDQDHEQLVPWEEAFKTTFGDHANIAFSTPWCLEIMDANVSKGHALKAVANDLQLTLNNCIAFGDGMNDVEMLSMAHQGFIMGTAHDKLKAALPNHPLIGDCADQAVAHYLETHLL